MNKVRKIRRVVLQAGHGGLAGEQFDPGALGPNGERENTEVRQIIGHLDRILQVVGVPTLVAPDARLAPSIRWINANCNSSDWVIEVHKDSAASMSPSLRRRMGVYYLGGDKGSQEVADAMARQFILAGAHPSTWSRPDTVSRHGSLGWLRDTKPVAHLVECGFMQDDLSDNADKFYAIAMAAAICTCLNFKFDVIWWLQNEGIK